MCVSSIFGWRINDLPFTSSTIYHGLRHKIHTRPCWMINQRMTVQYCAKVTQAKCANFVLCSRETLQENSRESSRDNSRPLGFRSVGSSAILKHVRRYDWREIEHSSLKYHVVESVSTPQNTMCELQPLYFIGVSNQLAIGGALQSPARLRDLRAVE